MEQLTFKTGELIIKQGDLGCNAYRITRGQVEVFLSRSKKSFVLGRLGAGEFFGEMGMIEDKPRSASVQAVEPTDVEVITPRDFNEFILKNPDKLIPYLKSFFERLRRANELSFFQLPSSEPPTESSGSSSEIDPGTVRMAAQTEELRRRIPKPEVLIHKFPYRIGRWSENVQADVFVSNDLLIRDESPYQISRNHCAIEREGDHYCVLDRGSAQGTAVNGKRIGGIENQMIAPLHSGENEVLLGGENSAYRFKVVVS